MKNTNLVVNWHITEKCNYHCKFCFAKWGKQKETWDNFADAKAIIDNLYSEWKPNFRLNFVGGEPLLFKDKILPVMEYAGSLGMDLSVQTNGTYLETLLPVIGYISQIGISIDSWDAESNIEIGRCSGKKTLSLQELQSKIELLRNAGGKFKLKINTVVSEWNWQDTVVPQMKELTCDKIKILRQMPFGTSKGISDFQFYSFINDNFDFSLPIYIEDNEIMTESYLMIAPNGRLFQNGTGSTYTYSDSLVTTPFAIARKQINFNLYKFDERYKCDKTFEIVAKALQAVS